MKGPAPTSVYSSKQRRRRRLVGSACQALSPGLRRRQRRQRRLGGSGDGELDGTAIETSITGKFKITVHKKASFSLPWQPILDFPLGETADTFSSP